MTIVIANEPRIYRQALAAALRMRRPSDSIFQVEPARLKALIASLSPDAVVSSRPTGDAQNGVMSLILYPCGDDAAIVDVGDRSLEVRLPDLQLVLAFLTFVSASR